MNSATLETRYHPAAIALHWTLAIALASIFAVGLYMADLPFSPQRLKLYNWHKWAGVFILMLSVIRLTFRYIKPPPALPQVVASAMPGWQTRAYHATHGLLYALFFAVPLLGWTYSSAAGFPIVLLGLLLLPDLVQPSKELAEILKPLHASAAYGLAALAALHIAAALKHHWVDRDGLLMRMLPRQR